jgi:hypothetical protein
MDFCSDSISQSFANHAWIDRPRFGFAGGLSIANMAF